MPLRQPSVHDRADGVDHVPAGEIEPRRDLGLSGRLLVSLRGHDLGADVSQLHARVGVDAVVDAAVARLVAAGHAGVRRVHDRVAPECRNVALPEIDPRLDRHQTVDLRDSSFRDGFAQIVILNAEHFLIDRAGHADIHQPPQQLSLLRLIGRNLRAAIPRLLGEQRVNQIPPFFFVIHGIHFFHFLCLYYTESVKRVAFCFLRDYNERNRYVILSAAKRSRRILAAQLYRRRLFSFASKPRSFDCALARSAQDDRESEQWEQ